MKVLTYNIWEGGVNESGGDRRERIVRVIRESRVDIAVLVEAKGFDESLAQWERDLGMQGALGLAPSHYHVALFTKPSCPIRSAGTFHLPAFYHACLQARVGSPWGDLTLLAAHLNPLDPEARLGEARYLAREAREDHPVLLMGDFNGLAPGDVPGPGVHDLSRRMRARHIMVPDGLIPSQPPLDTRAVALLEWAGYSDLFRKLNPGDSGWTIPTSAARKREPVPMRLDYVFATAPLAARARSCSVIRSPDADVASDHYPIVTTFGE